MEKGMEAMEASKMQIGQRGVRTRGAVYEVLHAIIVGKSSGMRKRKKKKRIPREVSKSPEISRQRKEFSETWVNAGLSNLSILRPIWGCTFFELFEAVYKIGIWVLTGV